MMNPGNMAALAKSSSYDKNAVEKADAGETQGQQESASNATSTPVRQNSSGGGGGFFGMIGSLFEGAGSAAQGYFQFKGMEASASSGTDQVREMMKHRRFLERQGRISFTNELIAEKVKGSQFASAAAQESRERTSRQRTYVFLGIAAAAVLGVGGSLFLIARRS